MKRHNICGSCGLSRYQARLGLIDNPCDQMDEKHMWTY